MYQWVVYLHILAALVFFVSHGASAAMAFRIGQERDPERLRALLDVSKTLQPVMYLSLLVLLLAGIGAGFMGNWWRMGWIGASLSLLIVLTVWMYYYMGSRYMPLRLALGMPHPDPKKAHLTQPEASAEEIARLVKAANPWGMAAPGLAITAVILWLMVFKPF